jgi:hypothetical protein
MVQLYKETGGLSNPAQLPWLYQFTADGVTYRGDDAFADVRIRPGSDPPTATIVYSVADPRHHRITPMTTWFGRPVIEWFGPMTMAAVILLLIAWALATVEHVVAIARGTRTLRRDAILLITNMVYLISWAGIAVFGTATALGYFRENWLPPLAVSWTLAATVFCLLLLLGSAAFGEQAERSAQKR